MFLTDIPPDAPVLVVVVTQEGCGHCDEYLPRFQHIAGAYSDVAILHLDANDSRPEMSGWMEQSHLESTPTTYVMRHPMRGGGVWRTEGAVDDATILNILNFARGLR